MTLSTPLELDPEGFRERINAAINKYNEAIAALEANKPEINPASFGDGFVVHGETIAASVEAVHERTLCLLYTSPSPRDRQKSRMPSSA